VRAGAGPLAGLDGADAYFAHGYAADPSDPGVVAATVEHDGPVVAAVVSGPLAGVQFHPERSGDAGARFLSELPAWSRSV
jgi:glutamine amidotransferase